MTKYDQEEKLNEILEVVSSMASLDFSKKINLNGTEGTIEIIARGLNMLSEELQATVVAKKLLDEKSQELEKINDQLEKFAHTVSHDLRSPLINVQSLAELIESDLDKTEGLPKEVKLNLDYLRSSIVQMNEFINGILENSKVRGATLESEIIDLNIAVAGIIKLIAPPEHVSVTVEAKLPKIRSNRIQNQQVFQNLITNAIKYNDKSESIIKISCIDKGDHHEFHIDDNGPGIPKGQQKKIFERFHVVSKKGGGSGLGLAIIQEIIENAGGKIWVDSEVGVGSTFIFTWPKLT